LGPKTVAGIVDSLATRLGRVREPMVISSADEVPVSELLDVDREYRELAEAGQLRRITPRRFNPAREPWLPVLHTFRGARQYTAMFSNTARAHKLGKTRDWVILYHDSKSGDRQYTVITGRQGALNGKRIVRGREADCEHYYASLQRDANRPAVAV